MYAQNLTKIWGGVGALSLFCTLNTWLVDRGAEDAFETFLIDKRPTIAPLFGIFVVAPLLALTAIVGIAYARQSGSACWTQRVPTIWLDDESPPSAAFKAFKVFLLCVVVVIPMAGLVHFLVQVMEEPVFVKGSGQSVPIWGTVPFEHNGYAFSLPNGVTFFPFWEPLVLVLLASTAWLTSLVYFWRIYIGGPQKRRPHAGSQVREAEV